ncbi:MAG: PAS domain-containing sensor histidine kinase [Notoacmeibacter sp.]|nr:PAS domain-containing sensor histidine kinase [Notoacmeibacter sp.]
MSAVSGREFSETTADGRMQADGRKLLALPGILAILGALAVSVISFVVLTGLTAIRPDEQTTLVLIAVNVLFIALLIVLIAREAHRILMARRRGKAASRLHVRIVLLFSLVAAVPAILVAVIASITLNIGLDRWFEIRTKSIVNSSLSIAEAYVRENAGSLQGTTLSMASDLDQNRMLFVLDRSGYQQLLDVQANGRALAHAALIDASGKFIMRATTSAPFEMPVPPQEAVDQAGDGKPVLIEPRTRNIVGSIIKLRDTDGLYLYTIRLVDPEVIKARQIVQANVDEYTGLEANRTTTQIAFALIYLGVTLVVVLSAIWTGIAVADRLVRPIRQLIGAADEVSTGNLDVTVPVRTSDGDVASLGDTFNKMLFQLKSQRNEILQAKDQIDERRRFSEAVLSGVTAGVIGVDFEGRISIVNRSAETMLDISSDAVLGKKLSAVLPHVGRVFEVGRNSGRPVYREQVAFYRGREERTFNVQITIEDTRADGRSYVVTIDDITDLVQAQRSSAWADVARRIAHEIKNPLTPIQLSAQRLRRKYGSRLGEDRAVFDECIDTIVKQVGDLKVLVSEFSTFARLPATNPQPNDLNRILRETARLFADAHPRIAFTLELDDKIPVFNLDAEQMRRVFTNILDNALDAIPGRGAVRVTSAYNGLLELARVEVANDGAPIPPEAMGRLFEPYFSTKEGGTGLGLAIVKQIVSDHSGYIRVRAAEPRGTIFTIELPVRV